MGWYLRVQKTLIRATMLLSTMYLRPPIHPKTPKCCTPPLPLLQCLKETHESRPFIFTICSIQCIWTSPWGKCGWTLWTHSPSYLGPFSLGQCLPPVSYLSGVPQSLMQIPMVLPNIYSKVMKLFWLSHWDGTSIFWEGSKCRSQLQLGHFRLCKHGQLLQLSVPHGVAVRTNCTNHEKWWAWCQEQRQLFIAACSYSQFHAKNSPATNRKHISQAPY